MGAGHDYWRTDANALADQYLLPLVENSKNLPLDGEYLTDVLTDKAIEFVEDEDDDPFFLQLAYNAPQAPLQARTFCSRATRASPTSPAAPTWRWWNRWTTT